jgi:hypothetical protein
MHRDLLTIYSSIGLFTRPFGRTRMLARLLLLSWGLCLVIATSSPATTTVSAGSEIGGSGDSEAESYWGSLPAPTDSTTARLTRPAKPLWEQTLLLPYHILGFPLDLIVTGTKATVVYLDESHILTRAQKLANYPLGPFWVGPRVEYDAHTGWAAGITASSVRFLGPGNLFKLRWRTTTEETRHASLGIHFRPMQPTSFVLGAGHRLRPNARYFGSGPATSEDSESFYTQETGWAGMSVRRRLHRSVDVEGLALFSSVGAREPGETEDVSIPERFGLEPLGYDGRSEGVTVSVALIRDSTTETGRPETGSIQKIKASYFEELGDGNLSFWTFRGSFEGFFPLWNSKQAIALRSYMTWIKTAEWDEMHFQRHLTNDDPDLFRGFRQFRWRGRGITALSVEYRWPLWALTHADGIGADTYLFSDLGQVFNDFDQISSEHMTVSYGFGVRLSGPSGFLGRLELAWSEEDFVVRVSADQIFQFNKGGLVHGRDQVALR